MASLQNTAHELARAKARAKSAEDVESRAEPGSSIDMKRHWADYRSFVFVLRLAIAAAAISLAGFAFFLT